MAIEHLDISNSGLVVKPAGSGNFLELSGPGMLRRSGAAGAGSLVLDANGNMIVSDYVPSGPETVDYLHRLDSPAESSGDLIYQARTAAQLFEVNKDVVVNTFLMHPVSQPGSMFQRMNLALYEVDAYTFVNDPINRITVTFGSQLAYRFEEFVDTGTYFYQELYFGQDITLTTGKTYFVGFSPLRHTGGIGIHQIHFFNPVFASYPLLFDDSFVSISPYYDSLASGILGRTGTSVDSTFNTPVYAENYIIPHTTLGYRVI